MESTDIVPFGKYKGRPIEVLRSDPGYCRYLKTQAWFKVYQFIASNFEESKETYWGHKKTPADNQLQAMFLNNTLCLHLLHALGWEPLADKDGLISKAQQEIEEMSKRIPEIEGRLKQLKEERSEFNIQYPDWTVNIGYYEDLISQISGCESSISKIKADMEKHENFVVSFTDMENNKIEIDREFESSGWDVIIVAQLPFPIDHLSWQRSFSAPFYSFKKSYAVKIKHNFGDDYPAVLRQMKMNKLVGDYHVLLFDKFTATGATRDQVKQIFSTSWFHVLSLSEIGDTKTTC